MQQISTLISPVCVFFFHHYFPCLFQQVYWFSKQILGRYGVFKKKKKSTINNTDDYTKSHSHICVYCMNCHPSVCTSRGH